MSAAGGYRCPNCGAPADPHARHCEFCKGELHPVRCPWCFDWLDQKVRDCPRCGASAAAPDPDAKPMKCPSCKNRELSTRGVGGALLSGCPDCGGIWADQASFKKVCEDRGTQAAYMGQGSILAEPKPSDPSVGGILYRPCAVCGELMNRFNFAGCSGVIVDLCKPHGIWFDADELRRIVAFIRGGGLEVARERERQELELARKRMEAAKADLNAMPSYQRLEVLRATDPHPILSARGLLEHLLGLD